VLNLNFLNFLKQLLEAHSVKIAKNDPFWTVEILVSGPTSNEP
jgi:hypothetical protein